MSATHPPARSLIVAAFAVIYVVWGSTYLGIRFAIETLPPFLMAGSRFLAAGLIMLAFSQRSAPGRPTSLEWRNGVVIGACLLLGGNGGVTYAEQYIPSGLAALLVATVPLFMALLGWASGVATRPGATVSAGLILGLFGVYLLVNPHPGQARGNVLGSIVVLVASLLWSVGSLYSRQSGGNTSPFRAAALQMICGGGLLLMAGAFTGEWHQLDLAHASARSVGAFLYLVFVGSLLGFTAYIWLLRVCAPAQVATYAYVNPVVALVLGRLLAGERFNASMILGAAVIIVAVVLVVRGQSARPPANRLATARARAPLDEAHFQRGTGNSEREIPD